MWATSSNLTSRLAGFNGLEAGMGTMTCFALGIPCIILGRWGAALLAFLLSTAFIAFLKYNWYHAKVFPGDTGTLISPVYAVLAHAFMNVTRLEERDLVLALLLMQALYSSLGDFLTLYLR